MRKSLQAGAALLGVALLAAPVPPLSADWLVTREGARIETKGAWTVKGKLVVFTQADGTLGSLRHAEVDFAASERVTAEEWDRKVSPPPAPAAPPKRKSVRSLTDADFARPAPPEGQAPAPAGEAEKKDAAGAEGRKAEAKAAGKVEVATWQRIDRPEGDGLEVAGTLRNTGGEIAAGVGVTIRLVDETGTVIATGEGIPTTDAIRPQGTATFRAAFPGVFAFAEAKFEVRSWGLDIDPATVQEGLRPAER
jgi:hypothetical protein